MVNCFLNLWCLPTCLCTVPLSSSKFPQTKAMYLRCTVWSLNCLASRLMAMGVFAITNKPVVFLSILCTRPNRGITDSSIATFFCCQYQATAFKSVPSGLPLPGCTTSPAGLFMIIRSSSSKTISSGIFCGTISLVSWLPVS